MKSKAPSTPLLFVALCLLVIQTTVSSVFFAIFLKARYCKNNKILLGSEDSEEEENMIFVENQLKRKYKVVERRIVRAQTKLIDRVKLDDTKRGRETPVGELQSRDLMLITDEQTRHENYILNLERVDLQEYKFKKPDEEADECEICNENFERFGDSVVVFPCDPTHYFHLECASEWLSTHKSCPKCHKNLDELKEPEQIK